MHSDDRHNEDSKEGGISAVEERMIRIMQYCDGLLSPREAALVAEEIARDPEAARLAAEMSAGADAARSAWGDLESGPVPFDLARRVTQSARTPLRHERPAAGDWRLAASLVVGIALGMLGLLLAQHQGGEGLRLAGSGPAAGAAWQPALMSALAKDPETRSVGFSDGAGEQSIGVSRWFDTAAGLRCAEFSRSAGGTVTGGGIACSKPDGGWDVIEQAR